MAKPHFVFEQELDIDFLNSIYEDDLEHAEMIFEQYLQQTPVLVKNMEDGLKKGVVEEFRQTVHKIKPVFSYVGLTALTVKAQQLEKKCKEVSDMNELNQLYVSLKNSIDEFQPVILNQLVKLKAQIAA